MKKREKRRSTKKERTPVELAHFIGARSAG